MCNEIKALRTFQTELDVIALDALNDPAYAQTISEYQFDLDGSGIIDVSGCIMELNFH